MAMIKCPKHGNQTGPHGCRHVAEAASGGEAVIAFGRIDFDIMGDGTEIMEHFICAACLETHHLEDGQSVPEEVWASRERFPYVLPVCEPCLDGLKARCGRETA